MLEFKIWKFDRLIENISPHFGAQKWTQKRGRDIPLSKYFGNTLDCRLSLLYPLSVSLTTACACYLDFTRPVQIIYLHFKWPNRFFVPQQQPEQSRI